MTTSEELSAQHQSMIDDVRRYHALSDGEIPTVGQFCDWAGRMLDTAADMLNETRAERTEFGERVRRIARELCRVQDWCAEGERDYLARLDLTPLPRAVRGTITVEVTILGSYACHGWDPYDEAARVEAARNYVGEWEQGDVSPSWQVVANTLRPVDEQ